MEKENIIEKYISQNATAHVSGNLIMYNVPTSGISWICRELYTTNGLDLKTIFAVDDQAKDSTFKIFYIFGIAGENYFLSPYIILKNTKEFPTVSAEIPAAGVFERKIKTFFGLSSIGNQDTRPILLHENWPENIYPLRKNFNWNDRPDISSNVAYEFKKIDGEGIYEIPVGPVHAGIIEPGHFRFNVAGEEILSLEARLGYIHKGIEKLFETLPTMEEKIRLSEKVSGDMSFAHSLAFCQAIENLADIKISQRVAYLRTIFGEMERLANHLNDIGFVMLDASYAFGGASGARLKESMMQRNECISGNRFLRDLNEIGGIKKDILPEVSSKLSHFLKSLRRDFDSVIEISEGSVSLANRLIGTGKLKVNIAKSFGALGGPSRAVGIVKDARKDHPYAAYDKFNFEIATEKDGDVRARLYVRIKEVRTSIEIIEEALNKIADGEIRGPKELHLKNNSFGIGITEGWRGEIVYVVATDDVGKITRVDVRDPSFLNWTIVGKTGTGNVVPDFPLINKSFNLSYSGNDL